MSRAARLHPDGLKRCPWPGEDPLYVAYHDTEWGVPEYDDRALYEKLMLDGFQAGLSWITILRKRDAFRAGFANFDPEKVARFTEADVARLLADPGIIRHRGKIEGTIKSARAYLAISEREPFADFLWKHLDGRVLQNSFRTQGEVPTQTAISEAMAKGRDAKRLSPETRAARKAVAERKRAEKAAAEAKLRKENAALAARLAGTGKYPDPRF